MSLTLPDWVPWWVPLVLLLPALLYGLAFLFMPFSVIGLKSRMEAIEARLAGLPVLEKRKGLYEVYLDRRGGFDNDINADDEGDGHGVAASAAAATATATPNGTGGANTARGSKTKKRSHVAISATPQVEETPAIGPAGVTGSLTSLLTPAASSAKRRTVRVSS